MSEQASLASPTGRPSLTFGAICRAVPFGFVAIVYVLGLFIDWNKLQEGYTKDWNLGLGFALVSLSLTLVAIYWRRMSSAVNTLTAIAAWPAAYGLLAAPVWLGPNDDYHRTEAVSNMKQAGTALLIYADQNDGRYPPLERWSDRVLAAISDKKSRENVERAILGDTHLGSIAMHESAGGARVMDVEPGFPTLYPTHRLGLNRFGDGSDVEPFFNSVSIGYSDSHVNGVSLDAYRRFAWPKLAKSDAKESWRSEP